MRKGEESEVVVYWNWVPVKNAEQKEDEEVLMKPVLRYYNVFHISQVDGVEPLPVEAERTSWNRLTKQKGSKIPIFQENVL